jgi:TrmH family RNA methyltransferase
MTAINSLENKKIKDLVRLQKTGARRRQGLVVIDGRREIEMALKAGLEAAALFYCPSLMIGRSRLTDNSFGLREEKLVEVSRAVFQKICYKEKPDGFLLLAKEPIRKLDNIELKKNPLVVILEAVEKPGNLGAIIRTAYAVGADAVIVNSHQTDIYNPNVIRASEGFVFIEPVLRVGLTETIAWLKKHKIKSLAAATSGAEYYTSVSLKGPIAIVLGSEADGLSQEWLKAADKLIKIPMKEGIDSLNVSVAGAIITFEALRQRSDF